MRFGVVLGGDPTTAASEARLLEEHGFDTAWFPDAPLLGYGDPYACAALAAAATERLRFGTIIAPASMRPAPVLLTHFATLNRLAPGRIRLGWGSGSFSSHITGGSPLKMRQIRDELQMLLALRDQGAADFDGTPIRVRTWDRLSLNLDDAMPVEVAASGPRTAALAGELADGLITTGELRAEKLRALFDASLATSGERGRPYDSFTFTVEVGPLRILRRGETLGDPQVVESVQPAISTHFTYWQMSRVEPDEIDSRARDGYARFLAWAADRYGSDPEEQFRGLSDRYVGRNVEHDQFITPGVIQACTIAAPIEEVADRLDEIRRAGATDVAVLRPLDRPYLDADAVTDLVALMERVG